MDKPVLLQDTVELMTSSSYQDRFVAEFYQLKIRRDKLADMCKKWDAGALDFQPTCSRETYTVQLQAMNKYLDILTIRAEVEGISL